MISPKPPKNTLLTEGREQLPAQCVLFYPSEDIPLSLQQRSVQPRELWVVPPRALSWLFFSIFSSVLLPQGTRATDHPQPKLFSPAPAIGLPRRWLLCGSIGEIHCIRK